jgi:hypothetical protein
MLILNAGISHNSKNWLMWLTIEIKKTKKGLREEMLVQTRIPFGYWIITGVVDLEFRFDLYVWKTKTYT